MTATPARIAFITEPLRRAISTTAAAQTRYGNLARKSEDPVETFFDSAADAQIIADARQALLSPSRRRFEAQVTGLDEVLALSLGGAVPLVRYRDSERAADMPALVSSIVVDFNKQSAAITVWG